MNIYASGPSQEHDAAYINYLPIVIRDEKIYIIQKLDC